MSEFALESPTENVPAAADDEPQIAEPYLVLARKYRPTRFSDLIGQNAMVQTLANAIRRDRIAHAFLMTGVRGVGKTSTARLIAKALNCIGPEGEGGPTIDPCGVCEPCRAITEGRFIDVVEMDAASHTGVDDVREIIDAARYAAVSARYKIYIIDEVHMLSKSAFNALLKTLEEPPAHVKFIFATTEVHKVPVTVLSRTQRFDLKRIPAEMLIDHFTGIAAREGVEIEVDAVKLIAYAAEGSVRDGLSLLDQAIAHGSGSVEAEAVRAMLGLSDRSRTRSLLSHVLEGNAKAAVEELGEQYTLGVSPDMALEALLETVHSVTRMQVGADADLVTSPEGKQKLAEWADQLSPATLHRFWQLLLTGLEEVKRGTMALQTAEMVLLRLIHAAQMPDPGALLKALESASGADMPEAAPAPSPPRAAKAARAEAARAEAEGTDAEGIGTERAVTERPAFEGLPADFQQLLNFFVRAEPKVEAWLHDEVGLVRYDGRELVLSGKENLERVRELREEVRSRFGADLPVRFEETGGVLSVQEQKDAAEAAERAMVLADPNVRQVLETFPDAKLVSYQLDDSGAGAGAPKQRNAR